MSPGLRRWPHFRGISKFHPHRVCSAFQRGRGRKQNRDPHVNRSLPTLSSGELLMQRGAETWGLPPPAWHAVAPSPGTLDCRASFHKGAPRNALDPASSVTGNAQPFRPKARQPFPAPSDFALEAAHGEAGREKPTFWQSFSGRIGIACLSLTLLV